MERSPLIRRSGRDCCTSIQAIGAPSLAAAFAAFIESADPRAVVELSPPHAVRLANDAFELQAREAGLRTIEGRPLAKVVRGAAEIGLDALIARVSRRRGAEARVLVRLGEPARYLEVWLRRPRHPLLAGTLVYEARDATERERSRLDLERRVERMTELSAVASAAAGGGLDRLFPAVAASAARLCGGPAAVLGPCEDGRLRRLADAGVQPATAEDAAAVWAALAADARGVAHAALRAGETRLVARPGGGAIGGLGAGLRALGVRWLAAVPLGPQAAPGAVLVTLWPRAASPRGPDLAAIHAVAAQASLALRAAATRGAEAPAPLAPVLEALPEPALLIASDGRIALASDAARALLHLGPHDPGSLGELLARLDPRDAEGRPVDEPQLAIDRALRGEPARGAPFAVRGDTSGAPRWMRVSAAPVPMTGSAAPALAVTTWAAVEPPARREAIQIAPGAGALGEALAGLARTIVPVVVDGCRIDAGGPGAPSSIVVARARRPAPGVAGAPGATARAAIEVAGVNVGALILEGVRGERHGARVLEDLARAYAAAAAALWSALPASSLAVGPGSQPAT